MDRLNYIGFEADYNTIWIHFCNPSSPIDVLKDSNHNIYIFEEPFPASLPGNRPALGLPHACPKRRWVGRLSGETRIISQFAFVKNLYCGFREDIQENFRFICVGVWNSSSSISLSRKISPLTYPEKSWLFLKHSKEAFCKKKNRKCPGSCLKKS